MDKGAGGWLGVGQGGELHRAMSQVLRGATGRELPVSDGQLWLLTFFMARKQKIKDVTAVIVPGDGSTL